MMTEKNENGIREAFNRIEPAEGAKDRMLRNIRAKAELENATKNAQRKSCRTLLFKLLPAVAAAVIVIVGAFVLKDKLAKKPAGSSVPDDSVIAAGGVDETQVISYSKTGFSEETGEDPQLPPLAKEVTSHKGYDGYYVSFVKGGHGYQLYIFRPEGDTMRYVAVSYTEGVMVEEWQQGTTIYRLVNSDGATQEEMDEIKAGIH